ncbi:ABC transporter ATP-binding protein [Paenibacillus sp. LHD-117]|uniref:ABC transporter ATP-binding protein n=1 Tax=Paenibacillus sp. LHD-117 TaxID=3071412 RepID=UPI0027E0E23B|nr:ABC transporter ATP-binding protein [Paenibacillus sp. LHD-117]MDQ6420801.1 ABC transporter ATP-binding protein [Paenibacillus sp. LHD-117]
MMLEVKGVSKSFGEKAVLRDFSLTVADGEFVSLIGPSGSGKTTLFSVIGGLEAPSAGEVRIGGRETTGERGHVAYMPQQASLLPWRTVAGNIETALAIAGIEKKKARELGLEWLARVGLAEYADAYPHVLSGGMQQRVSFLRALLSPRTLMLLDEPFGALDALTRLQMQKWLLSIWEAHRRSVLLVTHSIEEALYLSDRVIVLSSAPAAVVDEVFVPFERPRREDLWTDPRFNELKTRIYGHLQGGAKEAIVHAHAGS